MDFSHNTPDATHGFTCHWRIEKFHYKPCRNWNLGSPEFKIEALESNWKLEIQDGHDHLSVYLFNLSDTIPPNINISASVLTSSGWVTFFQMTKDDFKADEGGWGGKFVSLEEFKQKKRFYLLKQSLTISFHVWNESMINQTSLCIMVSQLKYNNNLYHAPVDIFSTTKSKDTLSFPPAYESYFKRNQIETKTELTQTNTWDNFQDVQELLAFFQQKEFDFVTLRTPTRDFSVNKAVLCAKSPVFNTMFENKMTENDCDVVDIDDVGSDTMMLLMQFLHLKPLGDIGWDATLKLYSVADKYKIDPLKKWCTDSLKKGLSEENVCECFILADVHQDKELMGVCEDYFYENSKVILKMKEWKKFLLSHTDLAAEMIVKLAEKM